MTNHGDRTGSGTARRAGLVFALWSLPAWLMVLQMEATAFVNGEPLHPWRALVPALAEWYIWAPLTPVVLRLGKRFPLTPRPRLAALAVHSLGIVCAAAVRGAVYATTTVFLAGRPPHGPFEAYLWRVSVGWLPIAAVVYGALLAGSAAMESAQRSREGEVRTAQLTTRLVQAELSALRAYLHPHFLFNALHTVAALVRAHETDSAIRVIAELSHLLRSLLSPNAPEEIPLSQELEFVRRYLAIEEVRFQDRLRARWDVADEVTGALVPRLVLQPLVENAIRHGIARTSLAGEIVISAARRGSSLELVVTDDGPGLAPVAAHRDSDSTPGVGIAATRSRLRQMYGMEAALALSTRPSGGVIATIRLPYRPWPLAGNPPVRETYGGARHSVGDPKVS
ncbi:MAG TPA: histidine kinase [Longimicrobiaceae bacterium]|nr:histidine kinase [Longimicrobiaceae bacterium]